MSDSTQNYSAVQLVDGQLGLNAGAGAMMEAGLVEGRIGVVKPSAPDMARELSSSSTASDASASSMFSASSASSAATSVSTSSVSKSSSSYSSSAHFSSSQFRTSSKHLLIEDTCTKLELKGTYLHVECLRLDGSTTHSEIDLDGIIGFINGRLEWDLTGFSKYCFDYSLDGFFLVVKYRLEEGQSFQVARLDLRARLRNANGVLILIELNKKLSVMLSEVPWMKFKVIAEPDLNIFTKHPVMKETLVRIAETTVEHVTIEMHNKLTIAMESAISAITASAMSHVSSQMETLVQNAIGYASTTPSITGAESLHLYSGGAYLQAGGAGLSYGGGGVISAGGGQVIAGGVSGSLNGGGVAYTGNAISAGYSNTQRQEERVVSKDEHSSSYTEIKKDSQSIQGQTLVV